MNWFYAENGQQKGPVSDTDLASLAANGVLKPETLLWKEGMTGWQPAGTVRPDLAAASGSPMLGGVAVAEQAKDLLVQQLREGVIGELTAPGGKRYVGFWWRFLAWFIDYIIQLVAQQIIQLASTVVLAAGMGMSGDAGGIFAIVTMVLVVAFSVALNAWYHTWMVARFGGTLGKMALGIKVVTLDGTFLRWPRALGRWAASQWLNSFIWFAIFVIPPLLVVLLGIALTGDFRRLDDESTGVLFGIGIFASLLVGGIMGAFPWWMAGVDKEKRALHDRICATHVVWK